MQDVRGGGQQWHFFLQRASTSAHLQDATIRLVDECNGEGLLIPRYS